MESKSYSSFGTIRELRLARVPPHSRGGGGTAATALAFLAALLLAPDEARAADECGGSISSANLIRTCTAAHGGGTGTFTSGIIYHGNGVNPGAANVADLRVPGVAGSTWTITSGDATGFPGSGIALDSRDGDIAGGGLALTVGGTGNVNIRQHSTRVNDGSNNNNGIVVNNQFTGASTTTVSVGAGVTIGQPAGTGAGRMKRSGIRARVWLGSGAATFTSAATIHSVLEGIDVLRGDSADTNAATTITNSGDITAGTRGIYLRYLAGDTQGGGGNTASTTTGAAMITNSGVITKHTGTGNQGAIELDYDRGHGAATITNRGAITYGSGATGGYGIYLHYRNRAGTASGAAMITNTADVASRKHAIYLENAGAGASTITNSGDLGVSDGSQALPDREQSGIFLQDTGTAGAVTVTNSGDLTSVGVGIGAWTRNKNAAGSPAGVSITHSAGDIDVSAGGGILAVVGEAGGGRPVNTGDAVIRVTGGSVESMGTIVEAKNFEAGDVDIDVAEGVTLTSTDQHGIFAELHADNTTGGVTIDNKGTVTTPKTGIYVRRHAPAGAGDISITNSGDIETGVANWYGILVEDKGAGAITVTNSGDIGERDARHGHGIHVEKQGDNGEGSGSVTVTSSGKVFTAGRGVYAVVNDGLARIDVTGGSFDVVNTIVEAKNLRRGNVDIDVAEGVTLISSEQHGVFAETGAANAAGSIDVDNKGTITTPKTGIFVRHPAGRGAISVTNSGAIMKRGADNWMGIFVEEKGSGPVTVTNSGDIGAADDRARHDHGILVQLQHPRDVPAGDVTVTNSGDLRAALFGLWVPVKEADRRIVIEQSGAIAARKGIYAQVGRASTGGETRTEEEQPLIDVRWTGGAFSHGTETAESDTAKLRAESVAGALDTNLEFVAHETIVREGPAAGIEAQVMGWSHVARVVAEGDDPGEIPDDAAEAADTLSDRHTNLLSADHADSRRAAILAHFKAVFEIEDLAIDPSVAEAIDTDGTAGRSDDEIVAYLSKDDDATRALLRNVLAQSLSEKERAVLKAVLEAVLEDDGAGLSAALDDADAGFSDEYKTAVRALLGRYHIGDVRVAVTGGSIDSRGDGIRAYYATHHENNGAIEVTVGKDASVTGGVAGIWVANAGHEGEGGERILKQSVTVHGTVTGGTEAAVHLVGGGTLTVGEMGKVHAGSSGVGVLVNHPGRAVIRIDGLVRGGAGGAAAVHLTGGGSVTVGGTGRVEAKGARFSIRGDNEPTRVAVLQASDFAAEDGGLSQAGVDDALFRLGTVGGDGIVEGFEGDDPGDKVPVVVAETHLDGRRTGYYLPLDLPAGGGAPTTEGNVAYAMLDECPAGQEDENGECVPRRPDGDGDPKPPALDPVLPFSCDMADNGRCRLYEALPSVLLAMNALPTWGERASAARDDWGGWARVEGASGKWKADTSKQPDVAYDHHRYGVRAGMDFAAGGDGRVGLSVHGLQGSAEMTARAGEVDLSGFGVGVYGTTAFAGGVHVDAQAAMTWYEGDLKPAGTRKSEIDGRGYALGVEVGKRMPVMDGGVSVTPRAGLLWSKVDLDDFRDLGSTTGRGVFVSVKDAQSLRGRAGVGVEKALDGVGMDGSRLFASLDVEQEFSEETEVDVSGASVSGASLKASAEKTRVRAALGIRLWGEGRYLLQGSVGYTAGGGDNRELGGGLNVTVRF